jgi:hypothetical protein
MEAQSLTQTQKLQELSQFFEIFKLKVFPGFIDGKDALHVVDHRGEDWSMLYTFKLSDDGKNVIFTEFTITSPTIEVFYSDDLQLKVLDELTKRERVTMTWGYNAPLVEEVNEFTLKMLVEHPAFFLAYSVLMTKAEIDTKFEHEVVNKLWEYKTDLSTDALEVIEYFASKFKQ